MKPTKRQKALLDFIADFIKTHGYSPSYREIKEALGYTSLATVARHIDGLIERGILRKKFNYGRTLEVIGSDEILLERRIQERYKLADQKERQIIITALNLLGFTNLTRNLKQ